MNTLFSHSKVLKPIHIHRILCGSLTHPFYFTSSVPRILKWEVCQRPCVISVHSGSRYFHVSAVTFNANPDKGASSSLPDTASAPKAVVKKTRWQRVKAELIHYYHGFRLFFVELKIACRLIVQVFSGKTLSRRERRHFTRTVADLFRMVPFLIFVIVPFMEFLLPFYLKFFPNALPSTFAVQSKQQEKLQKQMKIKLQVAKFLQDTLEETVRTASKKSETPDGKALHDQFLEFMTKVRSAGTQPTNEEILKFAALIKDELTLENLSHFHLVALCQILNLSSVGPDYILRFQINLRLKTLEADDRLINRDGIESLNSVELQKACRDRGMCYMGISEHRLRSQLSQWIDLHLNRRVPATLLLLSRAFYLPSVILEEPEAVLKDTISTLPTNVEKAAALKIAELSGERIDNKEKLDAVKQEEMALAKEEKEKIAQTEVTPPVSEKATKKPPIVKLDTKVEKTPAEEIASAIASLAIDKKIDLSALALGELKEDVVEHREQELKQAGNYEVSKSAKLLSKKINRLIQRLELLEKNLATKQASLQASIKETETRLAKDVDDPTKQADMDALSTERKSLIDVSEILRSVEKLKVPVEVGEQTIKDVISKMDLDKDNKIDVVDLLQVLDYLHSEGVQPSREKLEELADIVIKQKLVDEQGLAKEEELSEKSVEEEVISEKKQNP